MKNSILFDQTNLRAALGAGCLSALLLLSSGAPAFAQGITVPEEARPMTALELYYLYKDKSWRWEEGAGRMDDDGRAFTAWSVSGGDPVWASGRWIITDSGRLCMQADWHTVQGIFPDRNCMIHQILDDTIYQKQEPSGNWYIFRHAEPTEGDEFAHLTTEDLVTKKLPEIVAQIKNSVINPNKTSAIPAHSHMTNDGDPPEEVQ